MSKIFCTESLQVGLKPVDGICSSANIEIDDFCVKKCKVLRADFQNSKFKKLPYLTSIKDYLFRFTTQIYTWTKLELKIIRIP